MITFNKGIELEQISGIEAGHRELVAWIDGWLASLQEGSAA